MVDVVPERCCRGGVASVGSISANSVYQAKGVFECHQVTRSPSWLFSFWGGPSLPTCSFSLVFLSLLLLQARDELTRMRSLAVAVWLLLLLPARSVVAVKEQDFKKCHESGFCRRGRALADRAAAHVKSGDKWKSPYSLDASTIVLEDGGSRFTGRVRSSLYPEIKFELDVRVHEDGVVRVRMDEKEGLRKRYDEAASWALIKEPVLSSSSKWSVGKKEVRVFYGERKEQVEVVVEFEPLVVRMKRNGKEQVVLNGQGLFHMEHFREKAKQVEATETPAVEVEETQQVIQLPPNAWFEGDSEDGLWEETWKTWTDTKPKGVFGQPVSCSAELTPVQVPSPSPSILPSPTTATPTASHSMPPAWTSQLQKAKERFSMTHTGYTTEISSNTLLPLHPYHCTDQFL